MTVLNPTNCNKTQQCHRQPSQKNQNLKYDLKTIRKQIWCIWHWIKPTSKVKQLYAHQYTVKHIPITNYQCLLTRNRQSVQQGRFLSLMGTPSWTIFSSGFAELEQAPILNNKVQQTMQWQKTEYDPKSSRTKWIGSKKKNQQNLLRTSVRFLIIRSTVRERLYFLSLLSGSTWCFCWFSRFRHHSSLALRIAA